MRRVDVLSGMEAGLQLAALAWLPWQVWAMAVMPPVAAVAAPVAAGADVDETEFEFVP
jgi:hypothetical protein